MSVERTHKVGRKDCWTKKADYGGVFHSMIGPIEAHLVDEARYEVDLDSNSGLAELAFAVRFSDDPRSGWNTAKAVTGTFHSTDGMHRNNTYTVLASIAGITTGRYVQLGWLCRNQAEATQFEMIRAR